jgi:hypothetical protein
MIPFIFGRLATSENFTDREKEVEVLKANFKMLINTIVISPRRWGKSSVVAKVTEILGYEEPGLKVCNIDLFTIRTEEEFYISLAKEVLKATSTKWEEMVENARTFLSRLIPRISFSSDQTNEISFGISWEELKKNPDDILDLAESIAKEKGLRMVICIDEFQNIAEFENPLAFQKKLRSHWQRHTQIAYCLYGSKRHMLLEVFANSALPFYKFGHMMFLQKIMTEKWVDFIQQRFMDTEKEIRTAEAMQIAVFADNHPYYVQQLAQQVWLRTNTLCTPAIVEAAHQTLVDQLSLLFINATEALTSMQLGFLKAILSGERQLSAQSTLQKYRLGTSGNVQRLKQALFSREILDIEGEKITFQDPIYAYWLKNIYFKM